VVGAGPGLAAARDAAYRAAAAIRMRGGWYRHDIAEAAAHALPSPPASQTSPAVRDAAGGPAASSPGS
jgi:hypothetical protein